MPFVRKMARKKRQITRVSPDVWQGGESLAPRRLAYVTPSCQFPLGIAMSWEEKYTKKKEPPLASEASEAPPPKPPTEPDAT